MTQPDVVRALDEAWRGVLELLDGVEGEQWGLPTPCTGWSVHDLAAHFGAIESQFQGLPQPEIEAPAPDAGIDAWTHAGVAARRGWSPEEVVAEVKAASDAQLAHLAALDRGGWKVDRMGPVGPTDEAGLADIRLLDIWLHLLDLRAALGQPLDPEREPTACRLAVDRAVALAGWGAVKKAGLGDGSRVRVDLSGSAGRTVDVVVEGGRGAVAEPEGETGDVVAGPAPAFLLVAAGRPEMAEMAGGVGAQGDAATSLLEGYRIFT